jgi:DNA-binding NarL/FixJ family response regulator
MTVKVLVAEDCELLRKAFRHIIDFIPGITVVAECGDGEEAVRLAMMHRPDILLTDISMPIMDGLEAAERILRDLPKTKVVVLSAYEEWPYIDAAIRAGATGYVVKRDAAGSLGFALNEVMAGMKFVSPSALSLQESNQT